jgi:hypothetical protein
MKTFCLVTSGLLLAFGVWAEEAGPLMSRALLHNTVRIETVRRDGGHVGTGFFYTFENEGTRGVIPAIVTCWHLVSDSTFGKLYFALGTTNALTRSEDHFTAEVPQFGRFWIRHPDTNIDLAVMPLAPIVRVLEKEGKQLDVAPISASLIPSEAELPKYGVFQEVKFIGYPIGIWDEKNNLPIVRRGMTATDPSVDYNGRAEFLVDAAVFPGSSGSPVFIANESVGPGSPMQYSWIKFLGILYAVHEYTSEGGVEIVKIPTAFDFKAKTRIPANLGLVVKANRLRDFLTVFDQIIRSAEQAAGKPLGEKENPGTEKEGKK